MSPAADHPSGAGEAAAPEQAGQQTPPVSDRRTVRLVARPDSIADLRRTLEADLAARGMSDQVIEESLTIASELFANVVRHAQPLSDGNVRVHWKVKGGVVELEVTDGGSPSYPKPSPPSTWATSGRGLRIVRSLAHEWGVIEDGPHRTVWASIGGPSRRRIG